MESKHEAQEIYSMFIENEHVLEKATQEVEKIRRGFEEFTRGSKRR